MKTLIRDSRGLCRRRPLGSGHHKTAVHERSGSPRAGAMILTTYSTVILARDETGTAKNLA